jgi:putative ABC transport system ATP-binding protein
MRAILTDATPSMPPIPNPHLESLSLTRQSPLLPGAFLLRDVSFTVARGETLAVVGPSGAGKSSLLRLLNRLDEPSSGTVRLDGQDTQTLPPQQLRRRIGMMMQRPYLFPGTIAANVAYGPAQRGEALRSEKIDLLLESVGLAGYAQRDSSTLSGGEAQRVALLRALANNPEILLLDEPTSALDPAARESVESALEDVIRARRLTCIWVTHSREQARRVADHVLALDAGQVAACGTPQEVLRDASD